MAARWNASSLAPTKEAPTAEEEAEAAEAEQQPQPQPEQQEEAAAAPSEAPPDGSPGGDDWLANLRASAEEVVEARGEEEDKKKAKAGGGGGGGGGGQAPLALPEGWEAHEDDETGEIYFFNVLTGESRWEAPTEEDVV